MDIKEILARTNIWWEKKENIDHLVESLERSEVEVIKEDLKMHRITAVIGPRRTGKTTVLFQSIKKLIEQGTNPKNILFVSLDNTTLRMATKNMLEDVFQEYFQELLKEKPAELKNKVYIFLDEVQKEEGWAEWLKNKYDFFKAIKFIISGSSALHILKKTRETLVGRVSTHFLLPLTFHQFLGLQGIKMPQLFHQKITGKEVKECYEIWKKEELTCKKLLEEYILVGGFIEWFKVKDIYKWERYLQEDIIEKLFLGDIISEYNIKDKEALKRFIIVLSKSQGNLFSLHSLGKEALIGKDVVENYAAILKDGFIIYVLENYSQHIGIILRKNKKISLIDVGLSNSIKRKHELTKEELGMVIEQAVQQHIYFYSLIHNMETYFYRDTQGREIDVILKSGETVLPIEVKTSNTFLTKNIEYFMQRFKIDKAIVLTKSEIHEENGIIKIPYWFFLATL